jgi:hypothetical protein
MHITSRKSTGTHRALYDGRERLGSIEQRDDEFVARNRRGQVLGTYADASAAADAITEAAAA